ncbi:MAG: SprT-like domain-containing protein [Pyrinomonadaceae bacterium]
MRIGEICREMPLSGQRGLAFILVGKLFRRKIPREMNDAYNEYIKSDDIRERASDHKRERGRKVVTTSKGDVYDLDEMFAALNERYFGGWIRKPTLTWSAKKTYRILGHHDATHDTVAISKSLDSKKVPQFVVEYVVFHEMLHIAHPTKNINGRRYHHTPEFKKDERRFEHYAEAERWIENNVRNLKRAAKK